MITVRMHLFARPHKQHELEQVIEDLKRKIAQEDGCLGCQVYQNTEDISEFVFFEEWQNEHLAQTHLASNNLAVLVGAGSLLTRKVSVSLGTESSTPLLSESFAERVVKNGLGDLRG